MAVTPDVRAMRLAAAGSTDPLTILAYADALEEAGDTKGAECARRVAADENTSSVSAFLRMCWHMELMFATINDRVEESMRDACREYIEKRMAQTRPRGDRQDARRSTT